MFKFSHSTSIIFAMLFFALPLLRAATAVKRRNGTDPVNFCSAGIQCCDSLQPSTSSEVLAGIGPVWTAFLSFMGQIQDDRQAGLNCVIAKPSMVGVTANTCAGTSACCTGGVYNNLVSLSCVPVNLG